MSLQIKKLRQTLSLTQKAFGERIGLKPNSVSDIENGKNSLTDIVSKSICKEFGVNEKWLRTGEGKMFNQLREDDEVAIYVSDLLEETNPFYDLILDIMKSYQKLDPKSKEVIHQMSENLVEISTERRKK